MKNTRCENFNAQTLVFLRESANLTQVELAAMIDTDNSQISRWESYVWKPRMKTVHKLAEVFQVEAADFELSSYEFSRKYNLMHPAWTASLFRKAVTHIHQIFDCDEKDLPTLIERTRAATNAMRRIADKLELIEHMQQNPSETQTRTREMLAAAEKDTETDDPEFVKDTDADPRA